MATAPSSGRRWMWAPFVALVVAVAVGLLAWLYVRGGGPLPQALDFLRPAVAGDPLGPSKPPEQVLRTLRLLGIDRAVAGAGGGVAVARLELPAADSSADVAAGWLGGLAAVRAAYPSARRYTVQVFGPDTLPLVELSWDGEAARSSEDPAQLRSRADITMLTAADGDPATAGEGGPDGSGFFYYVSRGLRGAPTGPAPAVSEGQAAAALALESARPQGAATLPAVTLGIDGQQSGAFLDAKNRAAGLLDERMVPAGEVSTAGRAAVEELYRSVPGRPAPGETDDAATFYKARIAALFEDAGDIDGAEAFLGEVEGVPAGAAPDSVTRLRMQLSAAEAAAGPVPLAGAVNVPLGRAARRVGEAPVPGEGPLAAAVLAAADDPGAPASAHDIARFERDASLDASGTPVGEALPNRVLTVAGIGGPPAALTWGGGAGTARPDSWLAYRRGDGAVFWLAGPGGEVALTDSSLHGWAWRAPRASLVDSARVGRVHERYPLP